MSDVMTFPATFEEFAEQYKIVDTEQVYTNGTELVPIFRVKQWLEHLDNEADREVTDGDVIRALDIMCKIDFFSQPVGYEHWLGLPEGVKEQHMKNRAFDVQFVKNLIYKMDSDYRALKNQIEKVKNGWKADIILGLDLSNDKEGNDNAQSN